MKLFLFILSLCLFFTFYGLFCYMLNNPFKNDELILFILLGSSAIIMNISTYKKQKNN